jgi:hypothetical protein
MENNSTHIGVLEAARELGVTPNTIRKRLDRIGAPIQLDPLDRRYRRIPRDLLPTLTTSSDQSRRESHSTSEEVGAVA